MKTIIIKNTSEYVYLYSDLEDCTTGFAFYKANINDDFKTSLKKAISKNDEYNAKYIHMYHKNMYIGSLSF